jgi:hypothetical protein
MRAQNKEEANNMNTKGSTLPVVSVSVAAELQNPLDPFRRNKVTYGAKILNTLADRHCCYSPFTTDPRHTA